MPDNHLDNKSIVVSGAAGGFGQRLCRALDLTALDALAAELDAGASLLTIPTDVTDLSAMRAAVAQTTTAFGAVDVIVNNAGVMPQIVYAVDQPWGVSIGDITIRAAGDRYVL